MTELGAVNHPAGSDGLLEKLQKSEDKNKSLIQEHNDLQNQYNKVKEELE